jgi:hypothetical protein
MSSVPYADGALSCLVAQRGAPAYVRFDHGPEFIAYGVTNWCRVLEQTALRDGNRRQGASGRQEIDYNMRRPRGAHGWRIAVKFVEADSTNNS